MLSRVVAVKDENFVLAIDEICGIQRMVPDELAIIYTWDGREMTLGCTCRELVAQFARIYHEDQEINRSLGEEKSTTDGT